jgi:hypothetical protein
MNKLSHVGRANGRRGEVEAVIDGERRILCLTLGALAEIETAFGVDNIADLVARISGGRLGSAEMIAILGAALRGGGNVVADEDVADMRVDGGVDAAIGLVARLLRSTFLPEREASPPNPLKPQPAD